MTATALESCTDEAPEAPPTATPTPASIPALFARQAAARPDTVAIRAYDGELTYADLDRRSSRLAHRLREAGVRDGDVVGVCLERSAELVVALLGVLKAGGGYLALDPAQPAERHALLLRDAGVKSVVTRESTAGRLGTHAPVLLVGTELEAGPGTGSAPVTSVTGEDTAYIAYTSGSTGRPKGVCVPHRAVARLVIGADFLEVRADDVFLQYAPASFDASTLEIWGPLLNGARLVVAPPGDLSPAELTTFVAEEGITVLWLTAGLFHAVVEAGPATLRGLRCLLAGGDVLSAAHVERALRELPGTVLVNGYGPTENTTFTACHTITAPVPATGVPIGRPIRGTGVRLLDERLLPVPEGTAGELYATGEGLAHGYLGSPRLTAERFLPDPAADTPGGRMYRTGDLARRDADGVLDFHGRVDHQVKVRGFRIEPGEIEAALRTHPAVADACVVAQGTAAGKALLACYLGEEALTTGELREHLGATLPAFMLPARFVRLDALPLNANGKVDRAVLAGTRRPERPDVGTDFRAPAGLTEAWLAEVWSDLLEITEVGVDDDFFELGGHSLMAVRITGAVAERFEVFVSAIDFYENPTIAELAVVIEALASEDEGSR